MVADQPETAARADIKPPRRFFPTWLGFALPALIVVGLMALMAALASPSAPRGSMDEADPAQVAALQNVWGIRVTLVAITGGGGMVDLRFQVIDPDKAIGLLDPENFPALIDEASGQALTKTAGHGGHAKGFKAGRTAYLLYENTGRRLRSGSRVTLQIGDVIVENVLVR
jgi:hypothetical protein